jgi:hypothetical protein
LSLRPTSLPPGYTLTLGFVPEAAADAPLGEHRLVRAHYERAGVEPRVDPARDLLR